MTEVSRRYARLAGDFAAKIGAVPRQRWESPSPCRDWTALDVVRHVTETQGSILGLVGREPGDVPPVDQDPLAAWMAASAAVQADLEDPQRAAVEFDGHFGRSTFEEAVDRFICFDLVVHGWDLARATGQDERLDPGDVRRLRELAPTFGDALRGPGGFGPPLEPPPGADEQTRLLAFLGRQAWT